MPSNLKESRKYHKISYQVGLSPLEEAEAHRSGGTRTSKKLRIKIPTAKFILSSYRMKSRICKKKKIRSSRIASDSRFLIN